MSKLPKVPFYLRYIWCTVFNLIVSNYGDSNLAFVKQENFNFIRANIVQCFFKMFVEPLVYLPSLLCQLSTERQIKLDYVYWLGQLLENCVKSWQDTLLSHNGDIVSITIATQVALILVFTCTNIRFERLGWIVSRLN